MAPILKSLAFTTMPQPNANPVIDRRARIIGRLEEQKQLAADPNFKRVIKERVEKDGVKTTVEKQQRVLPWWRPASNGSYALGIRAGKLIEFEKGKTAIVVPSLDKLSPLVTLRNPIEPLLAVTGCWCSRTLARSSMGTLP